MLKVGNRKVIARLANRSLFAAKLRNMMAVCAIALTAVLFTTLFTLGIGSVEAFQQATMRQSGGSGHASAKYIDDGTFEKISRHPLVREISYNRILCDSVDNPELLKRRGELWYHDDAGLRHSFSEPTAGSKPVAENEIIMDTQTLRLLNVPQEIGAKVKLLLTVKGRQVEREFALSGWWEADPAFNVSSLIVSRAYVDAHLSELENTYEQDWSMAGTVHAYVMFGNTFGMEEKFNRVLTESGFNATDPESPDYVEGAVNWAYVSAGFGGDPVATGAVIVGALLIIFTGYLIIYNIFQISVLRDIRYYGLLKTIGATGRQIKRIIRRQAAALSAVGIPVGLALGFFIGAGLVPLVLDISHYAGAKTEVSADPLIFTGSALFAAFTVWISTRKPGRLAAKVSPVEAVRYTDVETGGGKKEKQSANGGKLYKMALSNLGRNKKRTALVLTSLSLSLVLLNTVFTLSQGVDMDKYLSKFVDTDFLFAHADYFNNRYYSAENAVSEEDIAAIEAQPGFEAGGRLYQTALEYFTVEDKSYDLDYNRGADGFPFIEVYGLDDLPLNRLEVVAGEIDREKLKSGGYILQGVALDDYGRPQTEALPFSAGDKVVLHNHRLISPETEETEYTTQEYEIMA
ncbi:MAG: ABC transporter permease, partial [Clostridiales bacterium]|nr:ABC transporter permease [Clostridiales bacterium]